MKQDRVYRNKGNVVIKFGGKRKVLSTSPLNGGITTHLNSVINIDCLGGLYECEMIADTYEEELRIQVKENELNPDGTTALSTAAWTEFMAEKENSYQELSVRALVTAGIDSNGMRAGDIGSYYEKDGLYEMLPPGTINIILLINQNLTDAALCRALVVCTEAKAAAIEELQLGSCYSEGIATGSGTDGTVIAANMEGEITLTDASGHSKLGELIGKTVKEAVKEALLMQTAASPARQHQVLKRTERYGITVGSLWDYYCIRREWFQKLAVHYENATQMEKTLLGCNTGSNLVVCISLYLHLMDQVRWGLIMEEEARREGKRLLQCMLYWKCNRFLEDAYPMEAWGNTALPKSVSLKELLEYFMILYIGSKE